MQTRRRPYYEAVDACCTLFFNNLPSLLAIVGGLYRFVARGDIVGVCAIGSVVGRIEAYECAAHNLDMATALVCVIAVDCEHRITVSLKNASGDVGIGYSCVAKEIDARAGAAVF